MASISLYSKREYTSDEYLRINAYRLKENSSTHIINLCIDGVEVNFHLDLEAVELIKNTLETYLEERPSPSIEEA